MGHPQNSPRGLFSKKQVDLATSGGLYHHDYSTNTAVLDGNSSGVILAGGIAFVDTASGLPGNVQYDGLKFVKDSTGNVGLAINTTGTTWRYIQVTSVATVPT